MTTARRFAPWSILLALVVFAGAAYAQNKWSWDGVWTGLLNTRSGISAPISIKIDHDKVATFALLGIPFNVDYSTITPSAVSFGDRTHYVVSLTKTGAGVEALFHGRRGDEVASLTKESAAAAGDHRAASVQKISSPPKD